MGMQMGDNSDEQSMIETGKMRIDCPNDVANGNIEVTLGE